MASGLPETSQEMEVDSEEDEIFFGPITKKELLAPIKTHRKKVDGPTHPGGRRNKNTTVGKVLAVVDLATPNKSSVLTPLDLSIRKSSPPVIDLSTPQSKTILLTDNTMRDNFSLFNESDFMDESDIGISMDNVLENLDEDIEAQIDEDLKQLDVKSSFNQNGSVLIQSHLNSTKNSTIQSNISISNGSGVNGYSEKFDSKSSELHKTESHQSVDLTQIELKQNLELSLNESRQNVSPNLDNSCQKLNLSLNKSRSSIDSELDDSRQSDRSNGSKRNGSFRTAVPKPNESLNEISFKDLNQTENFFSPLSFNSSEDKSFLTSKGAGTEDESSVHQDVLSDSFQYIPGSELSRNGQAKESESGILNQSSGNPVENTKTEDYGNLEDHEMNCTFKKMSISNTKMMTSIMEPNAEDTLEEIDILDLYGYKNDKNTLVIPTINILSATLTEESDVSMQENVKHNLNQSVNLNDESESPSEKMEGNFGNKSVNNNLPAEEVFNVSKDDHNKMETNDDSKMEMLSNTHQDDSVAIDSNDKIIEEGNKVGEFFKKTISNLEDTNPTKHQTTVTEHTIEAVVEIGKDMMESDVGMINVSNSNKRQSGVKMLDQKMRKHSLLREDFLNESMSDNKTLNELTRELFDDEQNFTNNVEKLNDTANKLLECGNVGVEEVSTLMKNTSIQICAGNYRFSLIGRNETVDEDCVDLAESDELNRSIIDTTEASNHWKEVNSFNNPEYVELSPIKKRSQSQHDEQMFDQLTMMLSRSEHNYALGETSNQTEDKNNAENPDDEIVTCYIEPCVSSIISPKSTIANQKLLSIYEENEASEIGDPINGEHENCMHEEKSIDNISFSLKNDEKSLRKSNAPENLKNVDMVETVNESLDGDCSMSEVNVELANNVEIEKDLKDVETKNTTLDGGCSIREANVEHANNVKIEEDLKNAETKNATFDGGCSIREANVEHANNVEIEEDLKNVETKNATFGDCSIHEANVEHANNVENATFDGGCSIHEANVEHANNVEIEEDLKNVETKNTTFDGGCSMLEEQDEIENTGGDSTNNDHAKTDEQMNMKNAKLSGQTLTDDFKSQPVYINNQTFANEQKNQDSVIFTGECDFGSIARQITESAEKRVLNEISVHGDNFSQPRNVTLDDKNLDSSNSDLERSQRHVQKQSIKPSMIPMSKRTNVLKPSKLVPPKSVASFSVKSLNRTTSGESSKSLNGTLSRSLKENVPPKKVDVVKVQSTRIAAVTSSSTSTPPRSISQTLKSTFSSFANKITGRTPRKVTSPKVKLSPSNTSSDKSKSKLKSPPAVKVTSPKSISTKVDSKSFSPILAKFKNVPSSTPAVKVGQSKTPNFKHKALESKTPKNDEKKSVRKSISASKIEGTSRNTSQNKNNSFNNNNNNRKLDFQNVESKVGSIRSPEENHAILAKISKSPLSHGPASVGTKPLICQAKFTATKLPTLNFSTVAVKRPSKFMNVQSPIGAYIRSGSQATHSSKKHDSSFIPRKLQKIASEETQTPVLKAIENISPKSEEACEDVVMADPTTVKSSPSILNTEELNALLEEC